jgi:hypothetical protein
VSVNPVIYDLGGHGPVLANRATGRTAGEKAARKWAKSDALIVGFWNVEVASAPFLDELLRALRGALAGGDSQRLLVVSGLNDDVRESLAIVLERRRWAMAELKRDHLELLGGREHLDATLDEAQKLGAFTAPDLAKRLELKLPNLHSRLQQLAEAGAIARAEDSAGRGVTASFKSPDVQLFAEAVAGR